MADHDFLVDLLRTVRPLVAQRPRRAPVSVAERGHVHAEQLELGAHIRAGKGFILTRQRGGGHPRHLITGRDQTEDFPLPQGAFADGQHVRIGGPAAVVNADPAALANSQPATARQRVLRTNTGRKDHHVRFQLFTIGKAQHQSTVRGGNLRRRSTGVNANAQRLDFPAQHRRAVVVELHRHQIGRKLNHVGFQPELLQGVRRFQPQQAAANHHAATRALCMRGNIIEIVEGAINKAARQIVARNRRDERIRACRQHQLVPVGFMPAGGTHHARVAVDGDNLLRQAQLNAAVGKEIPFHQRERVCAAPAKIFRQMHAVVGGIALLAKDDYLVLFMQIAVNAVFEEMMADHTVPNHHQSRFCHSVLSCNLRLRSETIEQPVRVGGRSRCQ